MQAALLLAASVLPAAAPLTPEQAIERQQAAIRDVILHPCGRPGDDEILVCGQEETVPERRSGRGYRPEDEWRAPDEGPWFSWTRGRVSLSCCSVSGRSGTGAGLSLRIRF